MQSKDSDPRGCTRYLDRRSFMHTGTLVGAGLIVPVTITAEQRAGGRGGDEPEEDVAPPEDLPNEAEIKATILPNMPEAVQRYYKSERPIELRPVEYGRYLGQKSESGKFNVWIKATGKLPDDPAIHQCVLAYASDMSLLNTALVPHGRSLFEKEFMGASLDHALWLHRPFRADDWLLYAQESPSMTGARGFARGLIFRRDGALVASVAQEGLVRIRRADG